MEKEHICYVISSSTVTNASWQNLVFRQLIKPAIEGANAHGTLQLRCLPPVQTNRIIEELVPDLIRAEIVILDMTGGGDQLAHYLLGIRNTYTNGTILIAQDSVADMKSVFRALYAISYSTNTDSEIETFQKELQQTIIRLREQPEEEDNHVQRYLKSITPQQTPTEQMLLAENQKMRETIEGLRTDMLSIQEALQSTSDRTPRSVRTSERIKFTRVKTPTESDPSEEEN